MGTDWGAFYEGKPLFGWFQKGSKNGKQEETLKQKETKRPPLGFRDTFFGAPP